MRYFYVALALFASTAVFGQLKPVKTSLSATLSDNGSIPGTTNQVVFKGNVYFAASNTDIYGQELYVTDLTAGGTKLFMDLVAGPTSSFVGNLVVTGDKLFFTTGDVSSPKALWISDGTVAGTKKLSYGVNTNYSKLIPHKGSVYFMDQSDPGKFWKTDGTTAVQVNTGTSKLTSLSMFAYADDFLYFTATSISTDIWKTDGTVAGTKKVVDSQTSGRNVVYPAIASLGNTVYFVDANSNYQLWKTDGSTGAAEVTNYGSDQLSAQITSWKNSIYYTRKITSTGGYKFARVDGTGVPVELADINANLKWTFEYDGKLFFQTDDGLWYTDGTAAGTKMTTPQNGVFKFMRGMGVANNKLYVITQRSIGGSNYVYDLWTYDSANGLVNVNTFAWNTANLLNGGLIPTLNNKLFLDLKDATIGIEPFTLDETNKPVLLKNINLSMTGHYPDNLSQAGDDVVFTLDDGITGTRLWKTDGTDEGTAIVTDLSGTDLSINTSTSSPMSTHKGLFFFTASDGTTSNVWRTDGTAAGTFKIENGVHSSSSVFAPDETSPEIGNFIYYKQANDQLWKTDGSVNGTVRVKNISADIANNRIAVVGTSLFILDDDGTLWKSDGTTDGTVELFDLIAAFPSYQGSFGSQGVYSAGNKIFMVGVVSNYDYTQTNFTIWGSDGTQAGTALLANIKRDITSYINVVVGSLNGKFYFRNYTSDGQGLWQSDGTVAGTTLVKYLDPFALPDTKNAVKVLYNNGQVIYFETVVKGTPTIFKTDGTSQGTVAVSSGITPGGAGQKFGNDIYFAGSTSVVGQELWKMDPTNSQSSLVSEIIAGAAPSLMPNIATTPDRVIVAGRDADHWFGIWATDADDSGTTKQDQQINFTSISNKHFNDAPFQLVATASSGLPITFEVVSGNATISGNMITITGAGEIKVKATQAGNSNYLPATGEQTFTVDKATQTVTIDPIANKKFTDASFNLTASSSSGLSLSFEVVSGNATISGNTLTITGAGEIKVKATQAGNSNYLPATGEQTFTVDKATQTVTIDPIAGKKFTDAPFAITASSSSGLTLSFEVVSGNATISGNTITITGAGEIKVKATQAGNNNYLPATGEQTFTVDKATQTVTVNPIAGKKFTDAPFAITASSSSGLSLSFEVVSGSATISGNTITITGAGEIKVKATQAGNSNYLPASGEQTFTVDKATQTVTVNPIAGKKFTDAPFAITASSSSGLTLSFEVVSGSATISGNTITITGAGEIKVKATQAGNNNYLPATGEQTFTVDKATQTITFTDITDKRSTDAPFALTATSSSGLAVSFEVVSGPATVSGNTLTITGSGDVTVKAIQNGNDNYEAASSEQSFKIDLILGLEEQTDLTIYPNPATTTLVVRAQSILLTDMLGHTVITKESSQGETTIDVGHLPRGMYVVRLAANKGIVTSKIVLK